MFDTRYLSTFELLVNGQSPIYLSHSAERNYIATFQFVNAAQVLPDGTRVPRQTISIRRSRFVDGLAFYERIGFYNCNHFPVSVDVSLNFDADFQDIFAVREFAPQRRGGRSSITLGADRLDFSHVGRDKVKRVTGIRFDRTPEPVTANRVVFRLRLTPHQPESVTVVARPGVEGRPRAKLQHFDAALSRLADSYQAWHDESTAFETSNEFFDRSLLRQSRLDVRALLEFTPAEDSAGEESGVVPSAGIPWYAVPFGRDSIITALQTLVYNPSIAEGTLRFLARNQGREVNEATEEEPGKILHELRRGELANLREIPHLPYFGTVDATPLFVVLFVETVNWLSGSERGERLYKDLLPSAMRAVDWIDRYGDADGDGYVEYASGLAQGVTNQGWKDSVDSLQYPDGTRARYPAALVEVQGYVYQAKLGLAGLGERHGDAGMADRLRSEAAALREQFRRDFRMEAEDFFAQALDGDKRQVTSVTSNVGHLLWSGIVDGDEAQMIVRRLMAEDLFSGWGIRTLSSSSPNFNPMSYHNGSVWPHDNSMIALGMRRYGFYREASEVIEAVISAGLRFPGNRLPELFCGFPRDRRFNSSPVSYIVSCSPQAWAAAAPFLFLQTLLGIGAGPNGEIEVQPVRNDLFHSYTVRHLRIGPGRVSLRVRDREGRFEIDVLDGNVKLLTDVAAIAS